MSDTGSERAAGADQPFPLHPIQFAGIRVSKLFLEAHLNVEESAETGSFALQVGATPYDSVNKTVQLTVGVKIGEGDDRAPYHLEVQLVAVFSVDDSRFKPVHVDEWANKNAVLAVYPYIREHVQTLVLRSGYKAVTLPLLQIPTYKFVIAADPVA